MRRIRHLRSTIARCALVVAALTLVSAREARAAAEVRRFNFVVSMTPTSVDGGDFNETIDFLNRTALEPRGLEGMDKVSAGWMFEAQLRYFVRPNMAINAGVGQMRITTDREYLPFLGAAIQLHGEVLTVPVHVGGAYYLAPYNQGDFQARAFFGAGLLSQVYSRALLQQEATNVPEVPSIMTVGIQDGPGYYVEAGAHMFFAVRYSVMLSGLYRDAVIDKLVDRETGQPLQDLEGEPYTLDLSGFGARLAFAIGF
jgi:outer membrane protein W